MINSTPSPNVPSQAGIQQSEANFLNLNEYLLPANPENALLVKIDQDSDDFKSGDLLVVDISRDPKTGEFVLIADDDSRVIEKYYGGENVFGVVTFLIRRV